jgi:hypothetical protein
VESVDLELDRLISKRASQDRRPGPDEREELWQKSVRAYEEKRPEMMGIRHPGRAADRGPVPEFFAPALRR